MMRYKEMIEEAKKKGYASDKVMWDSVDDLDDMLCELKKEHPEKYWKFIRKQHGIMYNYHYDEEFARWDVEHMKPLGMYWTPAQVEDATKGMAFPPGTTLWDKFVGFNAFANDLHGTIPDDQIIKASYAFWFADKDFGKEGKIWRYVCMSV
jgi:hypothetical protein